MYLFVGVLSRGDIKDHLVWAINHNNQPLRTPSRFCEPGVPLCPEALPQGPCYPTGNLVQLNSSHSSPPPLLRIVAADILYIQHSQRMSRLATVPMMFLAMMCLAGLANGLPSGMVSHGAKAGTASMAVLDEHKERIVAQDAKVRAPAHEPDP